jgi:RHS repeat-associated protein
VTALTNNQLSATGFSYDASGNLLGDGHNTYGWNAESEIKSATGVNYTYDGDGDRVQKSNGKIYWYGAGGDILDESDASGNITDEYVYFGGKRISHRVISGNSIYYYAEDFLGSSRVMTTSTGTVCYDADFYPFGGERTVTSTCAQNYKCQGKERDAETNNDDFGARYYSSQFGRWLSPDWSSVPAPIPYADLTNPQTLNLYQFVKNDPETFADVDGHLYCVGGTAACPGGSAGDGGLAGDMSSDSAGGLSVTNIAPTQSQWDTTISATGGTYGIKDGAGQTGAGSPQAPRQLVLVATHDSTNKKYPADRNVTYAVYSLHDGKLTRVIGANEILLSESYAPGSSTDHNICTPCSNKDTPNLENYKQGRFQEENSVQLGKSYAVDQHFTINGNDALIFRQNESNGLVELPRGSRGVTHNGLR